MRYGTYDYTRMGSRMADRRRRKHSKMKSRVLHSILTVVAAGLFSMIVLLGFHGFAKANDEGGSVNISDSANNSTAPDPAPIYTTDETVTPEENRPQTEQNETAAPGENSSLTEWVEPGGTEGSNQAAEHEEADKPIEQYDFSSPVPCSDMVEDSYFDDAVFIGDSRTEGLILYTGLSNAVSYTYNGLMVDTFFTKPVINLDGTTVSVMDALKTTSFTKVYVMFGINETGWPYNEDFIGNYEKIIDSIREINSEAIIYVQEILPVTNTVSSAHSYVKNEKISEYNSLLRQMANEKEVFFIDTANAVAGEDGSLPEDAAFDGIHLNKDYCQKWLDYLKNHTVSE